jgi:hypothetical protein
MKNKYFLCMLLVIVMIGISSCQQRTLKDNSTGDDTTDDNADDSADGLSTQRLMPADFVYLGAIRLPENPSGSEVQSWAWGGYAMTYYPAGDVTGASDEYPGSIYASGHSWQHLVAEISIPLPVISAQKNVNALHTANFLQSFTDIHYLGQLELPRGGLAYLSAKGNQNSGKLYFCRGAHYQDEEDFLTLGWCELNLANPQIQFGWIIDPAHYLYNTNDYMLEIPAGFAETYLNGMSLGCGRFRDGGWSGQGPSLHAMAPWQDGNPPAYGSACAYKTLIAYTSSEDYDQTAYTMTNYHHSDEWSGAEWLTAGDKGALVFVGTKGQGNCWYGDENGPCLDCEGSRGWWSDRFEGQFIFYDPADLAKVAQGTLPASQIQPYASLNVDQYLYNIQSAQQKYHLGACCFDRTRGFFYVFETLAEEDARPLIHVWKVNS